MAEYLKKRQKLLISIVDKGRARDAVSASKQAGAEGGTVIPARGGGPQETTHFLGMRIEPDKEVVLTLVSDEIARDVLKAISDRLGLDDPEKGTAFIVNVKKLTGAVHLLRHMNRS